MTPIKALHERILSMTEAERSELAREIQTVDPETAECYAPLERFIMRREYHGPMHICSHPTLPVPRATGWVFKSDPLRLWLHPADYSLVTSR